MTAAPGLGHVATEEIVRELERRGALPRCPCGKWRAYVGSYDADGYSLRCSGCLRAVAMCRCR
jgi:hypothetical protein